MCKPLRILTVREIVLIVSCAVLTPPRRPYRTVQNAGLLRGVLIHGTSGMITSTLDRWDSKSLDTFAILAGNRTSRKCDRRSYNTQNFYPSSVPLVQYIRPSCIYAALHFIGRHH